jgi:hypothetical protein
MGFTNPVTNVVVDGPVVLDPTSSVAVNNTPGVLLSDAPAILYTGDAVSGPAMALKDVSRYQSLELSVSGVGTSLAVDYLITWYADAAGLIPVATDSISFAHIGFCQLRCKGAFVRLAHYFTVGTVGNATLLIVASFRQLAAETYQCGEGAVIPDDSLVAVTFGAGIPGASDTFTDIPSRNGHAHLHIVTSAALTVHITDSLTLTSGQPALYSVAVDYFETLIAAAATNAYEFDFVAPRRALNVHVRNTGAALTNPTVQLTFPD